jgi:hypothetical protein
MQKSRKSRIGQKMAISTILAALVVVLVALLGSSTPAAQDTALPVDEGSVTPAGEEAIVSEWPLEVAVEWIGDVPGTDHDLLGADDYAYGLWNRLRSYGWCNFYGNDCYIWGNSNAWEEDFKRHDLGGTNDYWVDDVDLTFYIGHGNPSYFTFDKPYGPGTHDDRYLTYNDARLAWGNRDLEWMALLSCQVLADSHELDWVWTMDGLHLLLGFETNAWLWHYPTSANNFGYLFAKYITWNWTLPEAWFVAADQSMLAGMRAKVLAEEYNHFFDRQSYQYPDAWDYYYHRWEHKIGCEPPRQVDVEQLTSMPVFQTPVLSLAERDEAWGTLTTAFEVPDGGRATAQDGDIWTSESGGRELQMDTANGLYYYIDHNNFFTETTPARVQDSPMQDAQAIAEQFLTENGLMPADAEFYEVVDETVEEVFVPNRGAARVTGPAVVTQEELISQQVIYSRILTYTPPSLTGITQEPVEFSVVGPSAKIKVYVQPGSSAARVASPQQEGAVVGVMGGWRRIREPSQREVQQVVDVMPYEQVYQLFLDLEPQVAFAYVPVDNIIDKEILTYTLGYWEESLGAGQDQLYPAYVMQAAYTSTLEVGGTQVVTDYTYFPANPTYAPPLAKIESHSDLSGNLLPGETIQCTAADASQPLSALGYDPLLDFALGTGDPDSYVYNWYLGSVADENLIGTGRELSYQVGRPSEIGHDGPVEQHIILVVTDSYSDHGSRNTNTDSIAYHVVPPVYLPVVVRDS